MHEKKTSISKLNEIQKKKRKIQKDFNESNYNSERQRSIRKRVSYQIHDPTNDSISKQ